MPASLTEKELERLRLELWRRRAGGHMTMALSLDTVDTLLASARVVRKVEALRHEWARKLASNSIAHEQYLECMEDAVDRLDRILETLTATTEPTAREDEAPYVCPGCHAVAEPCAPGCIDAAMEAERREAIESGDYDDSEDYR